MTTIARKARRLARRLRTLMPDAIIRCSHCRNDWGCSSYIYVTFKRLREKIRISDHPVGPNRKLYGNETLYLCAGYKWHDIQRWLQHLLKQYRRLGGQHTQSELPLFIKAGTRA